MKKFNIPTLLCDFYKAGHILQYPKLTQLIHSMWIPRSNKYFPVANEVVVFGIQAFFIELKEFFEDNFFSRPKKIVVAEYKRILRHTLGGEPDATHIEKLHDLGYLPIRVKALKEGTLAPIKTPVMTIENTDVDFFWITNYLETLISNMIWQPMTSATIAYQYRKLLDEYAMKTVGNTEGVAFQGHDFSMRGMGGFDATMTSGAGHLLSFTGTDTIPAISYLEYFYGADVEKELVGASIPATEHSVMSANTDAESRDEYETFKRLVTEVYPDGFVSIVSDTYDFWAVVGDILPRLKDAIMTRNGKVVIRPDSGTPEDIICGNPNAETELERKGLIEALWDLFGGTITDKGYKLLDSHIGAIYGDSITLQRARTIVERLEAKGFASTNIVLGIGSYTYQYNTRDTFNFAMKATYAVVDGEERLLFKDPKTDDGTKRSLRGLAVVMKADDKIVFQDGLNREQQENLGIVDMLETVFDDGVMERTQTLSEIRELLGTN
jgi:nicotinamide phosphoribosyltransferase